MVATELPGYTVVSASPPAPPTPLRTDVAGFAGRAAYGRIGEPILVRDVEAYEREFGPTTGTGRLGTAVRGYFDNGGELAYVLRFGGGTAGDDDDPYGQVRPLLDAPEISLLVLPDLWEDPGDVAPRAIGWIARAAHQRLDRMLLLDLPAAASDSAAAAKAAFARLEAALPGAEARAVAVYHPWIKVEACPGAPDGQPLDQPPAGHVAGMVSRVDRERGPERSPANETLVDVFDLVTGPHSAQEPALVGWRLNPIRCVPGQGLQIWGARTFERAVGGRLDGCFIAHRRLLHRLVRAARRAGDALVFEANGQELRRALARTLRTVLLQAYRSGALAGRTDEEAFSVRCDDTTTLPADANAGRVICGVAFTAANPMEVISVQLSLAAEGRLEVIEL
jgi:uncharacterized protein